MASTVTVPVPAELSSVTPLASVPMLSLAVMPLTVMFPWLCTTSPNPLLPLNTLLLIVTVAVEVAR